MVVVKLIKKLIFLHLIVFTSRLYCVLQPSEQVARENVKSVHFRREETPLILKGAKAFAAGVMLGACIDALVFLGRRASSTRSILLKKFYRKK